MTNRFVWTFLNDEDEGRKFSMRKWTALFLALVLLVSSVGVAAMAEEKTVAWSGEWYEPYDAANKVTVHIAKRYDSGVTYPEGESLESNYLLNYIADSLNAEFVYDYEFDNESYDEKISLMIASGDIPDVFTVNATQLKSLIDADMIEPISTYYEKYASPNLKTAYDDSDGIAWMNCRDANNELWALPNLDCAESAMDLLWIRTDWLEKLGLEAPQSLEDIEKIALAFKNDDPDGNGVNDTMAIIGTSNYYDNGGGLGTFNPLFNMFGVYPEYWYYGEDGELKYGSIQPEAKEALTQFSDLVSKGVIEKEFATTGGDTFNEMITSGKCGIFFSPWWYAGTIKSMTLSDPTIVWQTYFQPLDAGGKFNTAYGNISNNYCVFKKGLDESVIATTIKAINQQWELDQDQGVSVMPYPEAPYTWYMFPISFNVNRVADKRIKAEQVWEATHDQLDPATLTGEALETYNSYVKYLAGGWSGLSLRDIHLVYHFMVAVLPMVQQADETHWQAPATFAVTDTMEEKWATLSKLENETYTKIMLGEASPDTFDDFVAQWKSLGGDDIMAEMHELLGK